MYVLLPTPLATEKTKKAVRDSGAHLTQLMCLILLKESTIVDSLNNQSDKS